MYILPDAHAFLIQKFVIGAAEVMEMYLNGTMLAITPRVHAVPSVLVFVDQGTQVS